MTDLRPGTSEWWLDRLGRRLDERQTRLQRYEDYFEGRHPLVFASPKFKTTFGKLFEQFADNFCEVVVEAVDERLDVEGFRMGTDRPDGRVSRGKLLETADADAWRIWQENQLDALSQVAHVEAFVKTEVSVSVWIGDNGRPLITIEDPLETIVETSVTDSRRRLAALKRWIDDDGTLCATLYLPDRIEKWRADGRHTQDSIGRRTATGERVRWIRRESPGEAWPLRNPLGVVPVVTLYNKPRLKRGGRSEIASMVPIQNAINKLVMDMLVAAEESAFRARWATGVEIPTNPETNEPLEPWKPGIAKILATPAPDAKYGEFAQTDLRVYIAAIEALIQHGATITRTPPHYFLASSGTFPSGESLRSAETGLVKKALRRQRHFGEGWEEVIRLAFLVLDDPRSQITDSETIWRDAETRTEAEHVDALNKLDAIDVPRVQLWEDAGYSPVQIERFRELLAEQQRAELELQRAIAAAQPAPEPRRLRVRRADGSESIVEDAA